MITILETPLNCPHRLQAERGQILDDLQSVERAFNDLHRKYERTKEVVAGFKTNEDILKRTVEDLTSRLVFTRDNHSSSFLQIQEGGGKVRDAEGPCRDETQRVSQSKQKPWSLITDSGPTAEWRR